jgi:hypothetical protein
LLATQTTFNVGMRSSETPEWYTPRHIIDRAIDVLGSIELDPCSNSSDPRAAIVPADRYYALPQNGLAFPWHARTLYLNPPYGRSIGPWVDRLIGAYTDGAVTEAIALLPARTDTAWFQPLFDCPICFVRGRLKFSGAKNSAPFPSIVVYLGGSLDRFCQSFRDIGPIYAPIVSGSAILP